MKKSRWVTVILAAASAGLAQIKPEWSHALNVVAGLLGGWSITHPADKEPK